jgi:hypothetical protein
MITAIWFDGKHAKCTYVVEAGYERMTIAELITRGASQVWFDDGSHMYLVG